MSQPLTVTIFEAINLSRREIFIGATPLAMSALIARLNSAPPDEIRRWRASEGVDYRSLEFGVPAGELPAFVEKFASAPVPDGWRVVKARGLVES